MLTARENQILRVIVNEYMNSAQPVGSHLLWNRYGLGISPATIRGVMAALTEAGFLEQPHTSAGRIPTERAYRLFLENAESSQLSRGEQEKLSVRLTKAGSLAKAIEVFMRQLSEVSGAAALYADSAGTRVTGLANIFGRAGLTDPLVAHYVAQLSDQASEWLPKLAKDTGKVTVRIGQENDDYRARQVSVLAMRLSAGEGYLAVIGPTRLPYRKVMALLEYGNEELERLYVKA